MKFVLLLCVLSVLLLQQTCASPVKLVERQERAVARQQATSGAVAAAPAVDDEDDDDEDDDDDDTDLGDLIDDDDDDEDDDDEEDDDEEEDDTPQGQAAPAASSDDDDEEDDDDDDYLDRLFDDILGDDEEEDDDDDDEDTASSVQNTIAAQPAAPIEDLAPAASSAAAAAPANTGISDGVDLPAESGNSADALSEGNASNADIAPAGSSSNNEGALTGDDDEADDEDEDDDDDDIIGDDVIEARREARELKNNIIDMSSDAFQERNNQFVDAIFARINRIVSDNYDPFIVQLTGRSAAAHDVKHSPHTATSGTSSTKTTIPNRTKEQKLTHKTKANKPQTANTSIKKLKNTKSEPRSSSTNTDNIEILPKDNQQQNEKAKLQLQLEQLQAQQQTLKATEQIDNNVAGQEEEQKQTSNTEAANDDKAIATELRQETRTVHGSNDFVKSGNQKKASTKAHKSNANKKVHNGNSAAAGTASATKGTNNKQKLKSTITNKNGNSPQHDGKDGSGDFQKAEGSLSGLASLKRVGNVKVVTDPEGRNSTIKAKFTLGPLILRVEKSIKRGGVENVKSATARTNEMIGRIKFSVVNDRATLMSIKVQQPKQVEVESKDNHDRTREFVWRRTPKIAKLVNEKLKIAAETFFAPQGVEVVRL
ncbi:ectodermal [Musca autumnalis]|uniref:ectodermal n=1 Tax=Musca autumnalis TaxID=221902 RepID=UPI003CE78B4D